MFKKPAISILLICFSLIAAEPIENTFVLRTSLDLRYKLTKNFRLDLSPQYHFDFTNNETKWVVFDVDFNYRFNKHFKLSASYRNKSRQIVKQHTIYGSFYYQTNKEPLNLKFRIRYNKKNRFDNVEDNLSRKRDEEHLRVRLIIEMSSFHRIKPYVGTEIFYLVNNNKYPDGFDILRYYIGAKVAVSKKHSVNISWIYEELIDLGKLEKEKIINLKYIFDIK